MRTYLVVLLVLWCGSAHADSLEVESASKLVGLMNVSATAVGGADTMADMMTSQNPMLRPYRSVLIEWFGEAFSKSDFEGRVAKIYSDSFTQSELRSLIDFYESPVAQKFVRLQPQLFEKGAEIGQQIAAENSGLLEEMINERSAELEALGQ